MQTYILIYKQKNKWKEICISANNDENAIQKAKDFVVKYNCSDFHLDTVVVKTVRERIL